MLLIDFVLDTVMPLVSKTWPRIRPKAGSMGVAGYSLGGLMSAYALFTRRHVFDRASLGSSSFWWESEIMHREILPRAIEKTPVRGAGVRCWIDMGISEGDMMVGPTERVVGLLQQAGMAC